MASVFDVAKWFLAKKSMTHKKLQKLCYYAQAWYCALYDGTPLFEDEIQAWVHGPVYRDIYYRYRDYHFDPIASASDFDDTILTTQEKTVFDSVINYFCCYSGKVLEHFTHNETPWLSARKDLSASAPSERIITQESIHEYFSAIKDKYHMVTPNDIRVYAQDMFTNL